MANKIKMPGGSRKKLAIQNFGGGMDAEKDESVLPLSVAKSIYNFDFSDGSLREGYGTAETGISSDFYRAWNYSRHVPETETDEEILIWTGRDGRIYFNRGGETEELTAGNFTSPPVAALNYRLFGKDVILLGSPSDPLFVWDGSDSGGAYWVPSAPRITSMTVHYERIFCTVAGEGNSVWFCDDLDPTNWETELDKGGFIQLLDERGKSNRVLSFLNYVYVFRDYGITRITAFADQSDFSAINLFVSSGKIYPKSVTVCGDRILFLAEDGLYRFDGLGTQKILSRLSPLLRSSPDATGYFYKGKYYLSCNTALSENSEPSGLSANNTLAVIDLKTNAYSFLTDAGFSSFAQWRGGGELLGAEPDGAAVSIVKCGGRRGHPTVKRWTSGMSDFGSEKVKTVREIHIESDDVFELLVESERGSKQFTVVPEKGITRVRVNLSGRKIGVTLTARTARARLTRPTVVFTQ